MARSLRKDENNESMGMDYNRDRASFAIHAPDKGNRKQRPSDVV